MKPILNFIMKGILAKSTAYVELPRTIARGWLDILAAKMTSIEHAVGAQIQTVIQCAVHAFFLSSEGFIL